MAIRRQSSVKVNKPVNPIVSGVRSLISYLPGQSIIKPLADFCFRGFGLLLSTDAPTKKVNIIMTGLTGACFIKPADVFAYSDYAIRKELGDNPNGAFFDSCVLSVKMINLEVEVRNIAPQGTRQGTWSAVLIPIKTQKDLNYWKAVEQGDDLLSYGDIVSFPFSKTTSSATTLRMNLRFNNMQDLCSRDVSLTDKVAVLLIGYNEANRTDYGLITSTEFSTAISIKGTMKIKAMRSNRLPETTGFGIDRITDADQFIIWNRSSQDFRLIAVSKYGNRRSQNSDGTSQVYTEIVYADHAEDFEMLNK